MSGYGVFINSMGYQLESRSHAHLAVQGKLHLGNSNKTGYDISYTSGSGLLISPYTSTQYIVGPNYFPTKTVTTATTAVAISGLDAATGIILIPTGGSAFSFVLPTPASLLTALPHAIVGTYLELVCIVTGAGVITISSVSGTQIGLTGDVAIPASTPVIRVGIIFTAVGASPAYSWFYGSSALL
jgi:hypothetical protein